MVRKGSNKPLTVGVVPARNSDVFRIGVPFRMVLEPTDRPGVKRLARIIKEEPETLSEFHEFIQYLSEHISRAAELLYQVGDERHRQRAEIIRNHAFHELEVARRYETDPDRLRACMRKLQSGLNDLKQVANEEEVQGH